MQSIINKYNMNGSKVTKLICRIDKFEVRE